MEIGMFREIRIAADDAWSLFCDTTEHTNDTFNLVATMIRDRTINLGGPDNFHVDLHA